ncbi:alpha/beta fold hydrolase [Chromobacterium violaceum]|uniref:Probable hydrolase n=1 Tax=Chromobacterium violaceum (strain ATCC 12472 / DSM 30191 / JCM 1249 / CCUG 213 / NBRC 12614 / NCIMB 9131 / NCTC 9757 / MK) TaxID=243365 RepID=Q7NVI8_CHRVO|nr:alpha/beta hydrolase [Chromobacterium violaceum]AAQ60026.1 probable hydrolase [Chromobacterium violaceum ATCC 12472]SUX35556.1 Predicted hydrolase of the alpha/beta superfamily [Chromobacterium violaceum]
MREAIHFAHANSFPGSVYGKMLGKLAEGRDVGYLDTIGHDPDYPVTDCWPYLVDESVRFIETRYRGPVVGVGHSLGGFLMFYAALKRPDLFRAIIILDSPLMGPSRSFGIWLAKRLGFIQRVTPGGDTLRRRDNWATVEMAHDYFARKPKFARFDPDCLADYALHGTQDDGKGGRRLKFRPQVEHDIYATLPHDFPRHKGKLKVPAALLAGEASDVLRDGDLAFMRKHFSVKVGKQAGSHLFPLEKPLETAASIERLLAQLEDRGWA